LAFESPLEFRLYTVNDILQFKIHDFQETFASLRLADLPLQCRGDAHDFDPSQVQVSTLLSVKTGGCPEDCAYCPQAARYNTGVEAQKLMGLDEKGKVRLSMKVVDQETGKEIEGADAGE
jgi:hypothetical protein